MVNSKRVVFCLSLILAFIWTLPVYAGQRVDLEPLKRIAAFGQNTVASAGTAEVLGSSASIKSVAIRANFGNSNNIYIGDSTVTSSNGFILDSGEAIVLDVDNITDIYIDADTTGDGVSYISIA